MLLESLDPNAILDIYALSNAFFFHFVPLLDLFKHASEVNVRYIVMFGQLISIDGLARPWRTCDHDLYWFQSSLLAVLFLDLLDVSSEATLAMPVEVN